MLVYNQQLPELLDVAKSARASHEQPNPLLQQWQSSAVG